MNDALKELRKFTVEARPDGSHVLLRYGEMAGAQLPDVTGMLDCLRLVEGHLAGTLNVKSPETFGETLLPLVRAALAPKPGQCDNAHVNLWHQVELLQEQRDAALARAQAAEESFAALARRANEQARELDLLREIVSRLPKTADGVPVVPHKDDVWCVINDKPEVCCIVRLDERLGWIARPYRWDIDLGIPTDRWYASHAAALASLFPVPTNSELAAIGRQVDAEAAKPKQVMPRVEGKPFRCECGANVFTEYEPFKYRCNGCGATYTGEPAEATADNNRPVA
jgi:hypothetical protein